MNPKQLIHDMISKNNEDEKINFKDLTREQKDAVHKAMKHPNWEENFLTKKQQPPKVNK